MQIDVEMVNRLICPALFGTGKYERLELVGPAYNGMRRIAIPRGKTVEFLIVSPDSGGNIGYGDNLNEPYPRGQSIISVIAGRDPVTGGQAMPYDGIEIVPERGGASYVVLRIY